MATSINSKEFLQTYDVFVGAADAPVTLVCFIDYESKDCANLNIILNHLLSDFEGKIKLNIRHFPMAQKHQKAMKAAEAAVAAMQEGLFWPMNNILFANQKKLGTISLKHYAKEIGTNNKRFLDQVINGVFAWQVREDLMEGLNKGIRNVPAVYVNDELFAEELTIESLSDKIQEIIGE